MAPCVVAVEWVDVQASDLGAHVVSVKSTQRSSFLPATPGLPVTPAGSSCYPAARRLVAASLHSGKLTWNLKGGPAQRSIHGPFSESKLVSQSVVQEPKLFPALAYLLSRRV